MAKETVKEMEKEAPIETAMTYGVDGEDTTPAGNDDVNDASVAGNPLRGKNMQTTTTVGDTMPETDSSEYKYKSKFTMNGDIKDPSTGKSILADKMVNEAHGYQTSKSVVNPFPADGSAYLATLDFKVNA